MTKEQLAEFLSQVQENTNLQNQLRSADNVDDVLCITKASGFAIDPYESTNTQAELSQGNWKALLAEQQDALSSAILNPMFVSKI